MFFAFFFFLYRLILHLEGLCWLPSIFVIFLWCKHWHVWFRSDICVINSVPVYFHPHYWWRRYMGQGQNLSHTCLITHLSQFCLFCCRSKSKGKLSPRSYFIHFERKWKSGFLGVNVTRILVPIIRKYAGTVRLFNEFGKKQKFLPKFLRRIAESLWIFW